MEVLNLSLKHLGLTNNYVMINKLFKGRKLLPFPIRKLVWDYWHKESTPSTLTTYTAKQRLSQKPKNHSGLGYVDTLHVINQRNVSFFENVWIIFFVII